MSLRSTHLQLSASSLDAFVYTDATAETLPEGSPARARVAEMARFYRFLNSRMPALLDDWEREREASGDHH